MGPFVFLLISFWLIGLPSLSPFWQLLVETMTKAAFSEDQLVTLCATAEDMGLPVQFRIPHTRQAHLVGRYLDLGLSALLVPEVVEQATVDEAVAYSYYPQVGLRSFGGSKRHGLKWWGGNVDPMAYAKWWNETRVVSQ